jgi:hypothetical protein
MGFSLVLEARAGVLTLPRSATVCKGLEGQVSALDGDGEFHVPGPSSGDIPQYQYDRKPGGIRNESGSIENTEIVAPASSRISICGP